VSVSSYISRIANAIRQLTGNHPLQFPRAVKLPAMPLIVARVRLQSA